jgi:hypothetical protein
MQRYTVNENLVQQWLDAASDGYCATTDSGRLNNCDADEQGDLSPLMSPLMTRSHIKLNWTVWASRCLSACALCSGCRFVSMSLRFKDCSWYRECAMTMLNHEPAGFQSAAVSAPKDASLPAADGTGAGTASGVTADGRACPLSPPPAESHRQRYGFFGVYRIPQLRAWWYEIPKSASTTFKRLTGVSGASSPHFGAGPQPGDVGFAVVRHPACRAFSAFRTAYNRASFRTNISKSPCPFHRFPYLFANETSTEDERVQRAVETIRQHGTELADSACGFAYHHMLTQSFFLSKGRHARLFESPTYPRPPMPTVFLRLESIGEDLAAFCRTRNASSWCAQRLALTHDEKLSARLNEGLARSREEGLPLSRLWAPQSLDAVESYYAPDLCLGRYEFDRSIVCSSNGS